MEKLGQIPTIKQKIDAASRAVIVVMHKFIFEEDGDRNNRRRLREFRGFEFNDDSPEFRAKLQYAVGFSIGDLISICNVLGIAYTGNAEQLRERIVRALMDVGSLQSVRDEDEDDEDDYDDESNDENDEDADADEENENIVHAERENNVRSERGRRQRNVDNSAKQFVLNYRDVEDSVRSFNGTDSYSVERWINDFEEAATMFGWDDLQKVVFAKKSLKGVAKLFIQSEGVIKTWKKLKDVLTEEFSTKINSAELHRMLERRRMKKEETAQEYFLAMRELASRGAVESDALFEYVINGINDESSSKTVLYGAKTVRGFKDKLEIYEKIRKNQFDKVTKYTHMRNRDESTRNAGRKFSREDVKKRTADGQESGAPMRCFNCGMSGHHARNCDKRSLGKKCFSCNKFGHEAKDCTEKRTSGHSSNLERAVNLVSVSLANVIKHVICR